MSIGEERGRRERVANDTVDLVRAEPTSLAVLEINCIPSDTQPLERSTLPQDASERGGSSQTSGARIVRCGSSLQALRGSQLEDV